MGGITSVRIYFIGNKRSDRCVAAFAFDFTPLEDRTVPAAGDLDATFGSGGVAGVTFDLPGAQNDLAYAVAIKPNGGVVLAGEVQNGNESSFGVVVLKPDGTLDTGFSGDGRALVTFGLMSGGQEVATSVAVQSDGKILVAGNVQILSTFTNPAFDMGIARFNVDGTLDTTFGTGGKLTVAFPDSEPPPGLENPIDSDDRVNAIVVQPDGKIVLAGKATTFDIPTYYDTLTAFAAVRLNTDGSLDGSFGNGGKVYIPFGHTNVNSEGVNAVALQADGRIVLGGLMLIWNDTPSPDGQIRTQNYYAAARLNPNGQLDTTFDGDGSKAFVFTHGSSMAAGARAMAVQQDEKILLAGSDFITTASIVRLNPDGSFDTAFDGDGKKTMSIGDGSAGDPTGLLVQPDGKVVIVGSLTTEAFATGKGTLNRLNPDGSRDSTFGVNGYPGFAGRIFVG